VQHIGESYQFCLSLANHAAKNNPHCFGFEGYLLERNKMGFNNLAYITNATVYDNVMMDNTCIILTMDNVLEILDDIHADSYTAEQPLINIPEELRPTQWLSFPVSIYDGEYKTDSLIFALNGNLYLPTSYNKPIIIKTSGICFNLSNKYYNEENGTNTYMTGDLPDTESE
jgi:hypothetical protein